jgi:excisionase family DNA binding protein
MEILSAKDLSKYLRINEKKIYQLVKESKLPYTRIGGKIAFAKEIIDGWLTQTTERERHIYVAGSDDVLFKRIVDAYNTKAQGTSAIFYAPVGSINGLRLLQKQAATMSCVHIMDFEKKEYNTTYIDRYLDGHDYIVVHLYLREQGLYVEKNNPKKVRGLRDLVEKGVRFANRNQGSGTRLLVDFLLHEEAIEPASIKGYESEIDSHLQAGLKVLKRECEVSFGIRHVAHMLDISFVPLFKERFDMVLPEDHYYGGPAKTFLGFFEQGRLVSLAGDSTGYDLAKTGSIIR